MTLSFPTRRSSYLPELRQLPEQLGFVFLDLAQLLGRARQAAGDFLLLAPDVPHGLVQARPCFGSAYAHCPTTASLRRREPAGCIDRRSTRLNSSHSCASRLPSSAF